VEFHIGFHIRNVKKNEEWSCPIADNVPDALNKLALSKVDTDANIHRQMLTLQ
jgi:hypothetical protein